MTFGYVFIHDPDRPDPAPAEGRVEHGVTDALSPDRLHVVFCDSGAGTLKYWAALSGERLRNLLAFRAFAAPVGPVSLLFRPGERLIWAKTHAAGLAEIIALDTDEQTAEGAAPVPRAEHEVVRQYADQWSERTTVWYCSRNTSEVSLLSAFLQIGPEFKNAKFIDVSAFADHISGLGLCRPEDFVHMGALARKLDDAETSRLQSIACRKSSGAALVRLFEASELVEKEANCLDGEIINFLTTDFQKLAPVFAKFWNTHNSHGWHQLDFFFLVWRFRELARTGQIEWQGLGTDGLFEDNPTRGEVRRAASAS